MRAACLGGAVCARVRAGFSVFLVLCSCGRRRDVVLRSGGRGFWEGVTAPAALAGLPRRGVGWGRGFGAGAAQLGSAGSICWPPRHGVTVAFQVMVGGLARLWACPNGSGRVVGPREV